MSTIVYRYGLRTPHENLELVLSQLRAAHKYRNALVEIERARRSAVRAAEEQYLGDPRRLLVAAKAALDVAVAAITRHRSKSRKRDEPAELKHGARSAREAHRAAARAFRDSRALVQPRCSDCRAVDGPSPCPHATEAGVALQVAIDDADTVAKEALKKARAESTLYWGSYLLVERAASASFQSLSLYDEDANPNDPRFVRWTGEGALGVQLQGGLPVAQAIAGGDTRLRVQPPDPRCWDPGEGGRQARNRMSREAALSLRVGSDGRAPVWASFGLHMDRPLPPGATVLWAAAHRKCVGPHARWYATLTLQVEAVRTVSAPKEAVAVDIGWRVVGDDEIRVAFWSDGSDVAPAIVRERDLRAREFALPARGELRLDDRALRQLREPANARSARDSLFLDAVRRFVDNVRAATVLKREVPDFVVDVLPTVHAWRSQARLAALTSRWRDWRAEHPESDANAYEALAAWAAQDRYLWAVEARRRDRSLGRRREMYRLFGVALARTYGTIVLEKFDKRAIARRSRAEDGAENETARSNRQLVATSVLVGSIELTGKSRGRDVVKLSAKDTTRTCPNCGRVEARDAAATIVLACVCGHTWDQDNGAADVLLRRWRERGGGASGTESARDKKNDNGVAVSGETRWQKARRKGEEKRARKNARSQTGA